MADGGMDMAMQNFTQNTLRGMGTGGSLGAGIQYALLEDKELKPDKEVNPAFGLAFKKFLTGMEGFATTIGLENVTGIQGFSPPSTPLASAKIGQLFSSRG